MSGHSRPWVDLLILGAGWTAGFLIPLLTQEGVSHEATSTTGRDGTIKFKFDPESDDSGPYSSLPRAKTILITFPLKGPGQSGKIMTLYGNTHDRIEVNWILLGSTGIFENAGWNDHNSPYNSELPRAVAEDELIGKGGTVLNLAGLYGDDTRIPKTWLKRVAKDKEQVKSKGSLHLIHGEDVARAILATHQHFVMGERWLVTDRHVYDWWDLIDAWGDEMEAEWTGAGDVDGKGRPQYRKWVEECMQEVNERALPRSVESLGRLLDSRDFWRTMKLLPTKNLQR